MEVAFIEIDDILLEIEMELLDMTGYVSENALGMIEAERRRRGE